jgi:DNA-binding transcriptional MerR regulator
VRERYYSLTQVCGRLAVKPHVLRYWEKEFELTPKRNSAGRRIYSAAQVERLGLIRHLVHEEKLTVKGARQRLDHTESSTRPATGGSDDFRSKLAELRQALVSIRSMLDAAKPQ